MILVTYNKMCLGIPLCDMIIGNLSRPKFSDISIGSCLLSLQSANFSLFVCFPTVRLGRRTTSYISRRKENRYFPILLVSGNIRQGRHWC